MNCFQCCINFAFKVNLRLYIMEASSPTKQGDVAILNLDCQIDTSSQVSPQLRFYYHMYGATMGTLSVEVFTSSAQNWTTEFIKAGQQHSAADSAWSLGVVTLPKDPKMRLRFRGVRSGGDYKGDMAIDSVSIIGELTPPSPPPPSPLPPPTPPSPPPPPPPVIITPTTVELARESFESESSMPAFAVGRNEEVDVGRAVFKNAPLLPEGAARFAGSWKMGTSGASPASTGPSAAYIGRAMQVNPIKTRVESAYGVSA